MKFLELNAGEKFWNFGIGKELMNSTSEAQFM